MGWEEFLVVEMEEYLKNIMIINYVSIKMFVLLVLALLVGLFL